MNSTATASANTPTATLAQVGKSTSCFSFTDSSIGPILAWCVSLVKLKPPVPMAAMPATMRMRPMMRVTVMVSKSPRPAGRCQ